MGNLEVDGVVEGGMCPREFKLDMRGDYMTLMERVEIWGGGEFALKNKRIVRGK